MHVFSHFKIAKCYVGAQIHTKIRFLKPEGQLYCDMTEEGRGSALILLGLGPRCLIIQNRVFMGNYIAFVGRHTQDLRVYDFV